MTRVQRESLQWRPGTRANTEAALRRRELVDDDGVLTSWGHYVLHVHAPKRCLRPERVEIPQGAVAWLAQRAEAASRDRQG